MNLSSTSGRPEPHRTLGRGYTSKVCYYLIRHRIFSPDVRTFVGVSIRANRLFGRPPKNLTYLCLWEFSIPEVGGHCDLEMIDALQMAIPAFSMSFGDYDNAPLPIYIPPAEADGESGLNCP
jgi:hypothetical protein